MSLDFDVSQVKDHAKVTTSPYVVNDKKKWHPVTNALIWKSMDVDLGSITEKNVDEWWFRIRMLQLFDGAEIGFNDDTEAFLTKDDIKMHIGLHTNVVTKSRFAWMQRVFNSKQQAFLAEQGQAKSAHAFIQERYDAEQAREKSKGVAG